MCGDEVGAIDVLLFGRVMIFLHVLARVVRLALHLRYQTVDVVLHHLLVSVHVVLRLGFSLPILLLEIPQTLRNVFIPSAGFLDFELRDWRVVALRFFIQFHS